MISLATASLADVFSANLRADAAAKAVATRTARAASRRADYVARGRKAAATRAANEADALAAEQRRHAERVRAGIRAAITRRIAHEIRNGAS